MNDAPTAGDSIMTSAGVTPRHCVRPPTSTVDVPRITPALVPRTMTQTEADLLAIRLRLTEGAYTLRMAELETMRLSPAPDAPARPTVRPGRRAR